MLRFRIMSRFNFNSREDAKSLVKNFHAFVVCSASNTMHQRL
jgi:hypothetical protein